MVEEEHDVGAEAGMGGGRHVHLLNLCADFPAPGP